MKDHAAAVPTTLLLLALCGCAGVPKEGFSHRFHRLLYRLTDTEIKGLQFYLSADVLAQTRSASDRAPSGNNVIVVPKGTPGVATEVGEDWIKVAFRQHSVGVPFLTDSYASTDIYQLYSLATPITGANTFQKVADVPGNVLVHDGVPYTVVEGGDACLLVDGEQLRELIDKRKIGPGVMVK